MAETSISGYSKSTVMMPFTDPKMKIFLFPWEAPKAPSMNRGKLHTVQPLEKCV